MHCHYDDQSLARIRSRRGITSAAAKQFRRQKSGRRRLMPNLEQVTCSEPTVVLIDSATSSRPPAALHQIFDCCIRSSVNLTALPRLWGLGCQTRRSESTSVSSVQFSRDALVGRWSKCAYWCLLNGRLQTLI